MKLPFERVVKRLERGRYHRILSADYSNLGVRLFDDRKFAEHLGTSELHLRNIGLVKITNQAGWNLPTAPTVEELHSYKQKLTDGDSKVGSGGVYTAAGPNRTPYQPPQSKDAKRDV